MGKVKQISIELDNVFNELDFALDMIAKTYDYPIGNLINYIDNKLREKLNAD